ncbi:MAG: hypothetical protein F6K16_42040, partial [Symploca sp. SIO2B6]|nr:hypothetical protein [Symploca sp. SIO2B6]
VNDQVEGDRISYGLLAIAPIPYPTRSPYLIPNDIMGPNFFVKFSDRKDIEFLITQLADMLAHDDEDMTVRIPGKIVPFRETWDD